MSNLNKKLKVRNTFSEELPADTSLDNKPRQVTEACFSYVSPQSTSSPSLISISKELATQIGLSESDYLSDQFLRIFTGNELLKNTKPYAMCYGGHQFGHWAGQLGDGRAINLAEVVSNEKTWALQLKGAGPTPYSRRADGLAVLRSSIREFLCSEAMYYLGVPTTRALSLALTGDTVLRDIMYDGNAAYEKGAIVCRVAPSFVRFGNFEIFAARKDYERLQLLTDYTVRHFYPELGNSAKDTYIKFFKAVSDKTLAMIVHWQRVGFVHGVMNTDNFSILGQTIDYGPYGWLEGYDPDWTPNTTDKHQRRYRYGNQPDIALWNLLQLANALYPLIKEAAPLEAILHEFRAEYTEAYIQMMRDKLGLKQQLSEDKVLIKKLEETLTLSETDMTIFFRNLANIIPNNTIEDALDTIKEAFYKPAEINTDLLKRWYEWLRMYNSRLSIEMVAPNIKKASMNAVNPKYVLRNYMAQQAIDAANNGDYSLIEVLKNLLKKPYEEQKENEQWYAKRPEWARHKVGCSMLSCSS